MWTSAGYSQTDWRIVWGESLCYLCLCGLNLYFFYHKGTESHEDRNPVIQVTVKGIFSNPTFGIFPFPKTSVASNTYMPTNHSFSPIFKAISSVNAALMLTFYKSNIECIHFRIITNFHKLLKNKKYKRWWQRSISLGNNRTWLGWKKPGFYSTWGYVTKVWERNPVSGLRGKMRSLGDKKWAKKLAK